MKMETPRRLLAAAAAVVALGACNRATEATPDAVAATVNGKPITQRSVDALVRQAAGSGRPDTPELRKGIVDQLALQIVIAEEAVKKGLDKSPEVAEQVEAMRRSVLANAYVQDLIKTNPVTDDMVKAEYDRISAKIGGTEYKARHILVDKEAEAKEIIARLRKDPGAFARLASEKSKDTGSKAQGGELGWFDLERMVPEFGAAVRQLQPGKFTLEPVKTQFGYHVILLEDSRPIEAPPLEEVKGPLGQQLQQQSVMKELEALKTKAKIEIANTPAAPAPAAPAPAAK